jgi:hypothetical protein
MVIEHLKGKGTMDPGPLYESPFIDKAPEGPQQVFDFIWTKRLIEVIKGLNESAVGEGSCDGVHHSNTAATKILRSSKRVFTMPL